MDIENRTHIVIVNSNCVLYVINKKKLKIYIDDVFVIPLKKGVYSGWQIYIKKMYIYFDKSYFNVIMILYPMIADTSFHTISFRLSTLLLFLLVSR